MADVTITSSGATSTYALTAPITNGSNIDFLNDNGRNNGVLLLGANAAEDAFNVTTTTLNGTLYPSANFGGSVVNFQDIIWIGRRDINIASHPRPETVRTIIIEPDTLADGVPARRLILSPDHALYVENVLIPAKELLNWTSIRQDHSAQIITYYHLKLARHDIIFAENTPAESFLDTGHRIFYNAKTLIQTHPAEMQHRRTTQSCAPLCLTGPTLAAIRQHIASRQLGVRLG